MHRWTSGYRKYLLMFTLTSCVRRVASVPHSARLGTGSSGCPVYPRSPVLAGRAPPRRIDMRQRVGCLVRVRVPPHRTQPAMLASPVAAYKPAVRG
jgi:hypothetical protein